MEWAISYRNVILSIIASLSKASIAYLAHDVKAPEVNNLGQ
jgi:hypothetical protein